MTTLSYEISIREIDGKPTRERDHQKLAVENHSAFRHDTIVIRVGGVSYGVSRVDLLHAIDKVTFLATEGGE